MFGAEKILKNQQTVISRPADFFYVGNIVFDISPLRRDRPEYQQSLPLNINRRSRLCSIHYLYQHYTYLCIYAITKPITANSIAEIPAAMKP